MLIEPQNVPARRARNPEQRLKRGRCSFFSCRGRFAVVYCHGAACLGKVCGKAGIKRFCMHALRHTYATRAIECGVNPKARQELLGHSSLQTTMDTYVHVTDESKRSAIELFQRMAPLRQMA